ncbi:MAG TPA: DUF4178 domain-containing protein, partial [Rubrivivax sp.]|nr:DUF4178 domain-containing protein [Rubrivivax sp.]
VAPVSSQGSGFKTLFIVLVVAVVLLMMLSDCSSDGCDDVRRTFGASSTEYQQCQRNSGSGVRTGSSGGSYGGWSSGGGHK